MMLENLGMKGDVDTIRIGGRFYSIEEITENVADHSATPTNTSKILSVMAFAVFYCTFGLMHYSLVGGIAVILSLYIHEIGHLIGMKIIGWPTALSLPTLFGPIAVGIEGVSAGRKAVVALSGPALGLVVGVVAILFHSGFGYSFCMELARPVLFLTAINLLPIKPFDGAAIIDHLLFIKHPNLEMVYSGLVGVLFFLLFFFLIAQDRHLLAIIFMSYGTFMFAGVKQIDNMSGMILRLRKEGGAEFEKGCFPAAIIRRMSFSLALFDLPNEMAITSLLREVYDRAREISASIGEVFGVLLLYLMLALACFKNPLVQEIIKEISLFG